MANNNQKVIDYLAKVFGGVFSDKDLVNRKYAFAIIANFESPKTGKKVGTVLDNDEIGEVINQIKTSRLNARIHASVQRMGDSAF